MSLTVFLAVLGAALLHAGWNAVIRVGAEKVRTMMVMTVVQSGLGVAIALGLGVPGSAVWPWLLASGVFHAGYKVFLAFAYEQGDLSRVYPIARGAAPLAVLAISAAFLNEGLRGQEVAAVLVLGLGILVMGQGAFASGESRRLVPLALASAAMTAGYSLVDGIGARVAGDALLFVGWLFLMDAVFFVPAILILRGRGVTRADRRTWALGAAAAILSFAAYAVAVWAMTKAPIALVTALRETSILFAVLIGWLIFGERMDRTKAVAAGLILAGVVLTRM
ncbi:MAG: EamA family transporter [Silicimonas sp.]|nr:EamA family transporter [Silicimonas sp.]NNL73110.1 EamA family transporter [Silicimonas sp.]